MPPRPMDRAGHRRERSCLWWLTRGIIGDFFDAVWEVNAELQREMKRFLAKAALVADQKTVALDRDVLRKFRCYVYLQTTVRWPRG